MNLIALLVNISFGNTLRGQLQNMGIFIVEKLIFRTPLNKLQMTISKFFDN